MKIKEGFILRTICGEHIVVGEGLAQVNFNKMISLNSTAAYLWGEVADKGHFSEDDLKELLLRKYDVDEATAAKDAAYIAGKWVEFGIASR